MRPRAWVAAGVTLALACGGTTHGPIDAGAVGDSGASSGGADGGGGDDGGGGPSPCPASTPTDGSPCGPQGLTCEWGTSPVEDCDTVALCNGGRWQVTAHNPGGLDCGGGPTGTCPSSFAGVPRQQHCAPVGLTCDYAEGRCACTVPTGPFPLDASAAAEWLCQDPASGCPTPRPLLGSSCSAGQDGMQCDYGACTIPGGNAETCAGGIWTEGGVACPAMR